MAGQRCIPSDWSRHFRKPGPLKQVPCPCCGRIVCLLTDSGCMGHIHLGGLWSIGCTQVCMHSRHRLITCRFVRERLTPLDIAKNMNLTHLKRVRRSGQKTPDGADVIDILLCAETSVSKEQLDDIMLDAADKHIHLTPRIEKVSRWPAYSSRQLSEFRTLWPVTLRKDSTRHADSPCRIP
jgi:hypothetical protein